ncbi:MAG: DUF2807 domain-containing protein [Verrucomicrobia bacterium]|nr:DUF2807 domain-containing protein [Verrucomicrobiota bacterium]
MSTLSAILPSISSDRAHDIGFQMGKWCGKQVFNITYGLSRAIKQPYFWGSIAGACLALMAWIRFKHLLHTVHIEKKGLATRYSNTRLFLLPTMDSGENATQNFSLPYSTFSVRLNFPATVVIMDGKEKLPQLHIDADQSILPLIEHQHVNNTLLLDVKPRSAFETAQGILITVIIPKAQQFNVAVKNGGKAILNGFECPQLECTIEGNSGVLDGDKNTIRERQKIHIKGQGGFQAWSKAKASEVKIEGKGEVSIGVLDDLYVNIEGEGKVSCYTAQPKNYRRDGNGGAVDFDCVDLLKDSRAPVPIPKQPTAPLHEGRAGRIGW